MLVTGLICALAVAAAFLVFGPFGRSELKFLHIAADGNFEIRFPGEPRRKQPKGTPMAQLSYEDDEEAVWFAVTYGNIGDEFQREDEIFDHYLKTLLWTPGDKSRKEKEVWLHGRYPGRETQAIRPPGKFGIASMIRSRVYLVDKVVYALCVFSHETWKKWHLADEFFDSFRLTKR